MSTTRSGAGDGTLVPASFATLLGWALDGLERDRTVFGLPKRSFWTGSATHDLSVAVPGGRAATPLGVAAGPHTQLAHNLVVGWLAGARVLELKTVQVLDRLEIPRPCIDAPAEGYNVEWSQELRLEESLEQYVAAWCLLHALAPRVLGSEAATRALAGTRFDASVGYDLAGIRSDRVARFLDGLVDASASLRRIRDVLPAALRPAWPEAVPARVVDTVTLSSFHGCPPDQIERIVEHLFARHALNVVVKLNPTLLGFEEVDALLHGPLGWPHVALDRAAFERDLQWDAALALLRRLQAAAQRHDRTLGVKLTNTLVVRNTRGRLAGDVSYLSGPPLHPIAIRLAQRLAAATHDSIPRSLSAGVNADNFAEAVACGFTPVTTCTDLLRPTGYRRLPRYLKALLAEMERCGTHGVDAYVRARSAEQGGPSAESPVAALANLTAHASSVAADPRYGAVAHATPVLTRAPLALVDCESCNQCTLVCPNGAFFDVASPASPAVAIDLVALEGRVERAERQIVEVECERQWVVLADFCNSCGNCDTFCPQSGGPHRVKARFHTTRAAWECDPGDHVVLVEDAGRRLVARLDGHEIALERELDGWRTSGGPIEGTLDAAGAPASVRPAVPGAIAGPQLATLGWLQLLFDQALREINPLSARVVAPATGGRPSTPPARPS